MRLTLSDAELSIEHGCIINKRSESEHDLYTVMAGAQELQQ